jgi:predicted O-methyltransferase YrrM
MVRMPSAADAIEELIRTQPPLHVTAEGPQNWTLGGPALRWLAEHVQEGWRTLETGCGHSSIVFALKGAEHTIVAPTPAEHERVRQWCEERGFSTERVTSLVEPSQHALPVLDSAPLDLGLIDGDHAFPTPFIDWYYIAERLRVGGLLILDDTQLPTCALLQDFLEAEEQRWQVVQPLGEKTILFRKVSDHPPIPGSGWCGQPWVLREVELEAKRERRLPARFKRLLLRLKHALRPRTRLRALSRRLR